LPLIVSIASTVRGDASKVALLIGVPLIPSWNLGTAFVRRNHYSRNAATKDRGDT
jgi:hypothetical protein